MNNNNNRKKYLSASIVFYGDHSCNGNCSYCCGSLKREDLRIDYDKLKARILDYRTKNYGTDVKDEDFSYNFDIWGGEPLFGKFKEFKELTTWLKKEFNNCDLFVSTNGLILAVDDVVKYLLDNHIRVQLSHDGLGQKYRTKEIDPLYHEKIGKNIATLVQNGCLNMINCTLTGPNPSIFENIKYFNKWLIDYGLSNNGMEIKMNHIYNSDYADEHNEADFSLKGRDLEIFISEYEQMCFKAMYQNNLTEDEKYLLKPYLGYFKSETEKFGLAIGRPVEQNLGACSRFQQGITDYNFVIDTIGEYAQCNLMDSSETVANPSGKKPDYCNDCRYKDYPSCNLCGSKEYPKKCEFNYAFAQMFERLKLLARMTRYGQQNNSCNCGGNHNHYQKPHCCDNEQAKR